MLTKFAAVMLSVLAVSAFADPAQANPNEAPNAAAVPYHYGMPLDIAKVVSITPPPNETCGASPATMVYIDSQGETQRIDYQVMGNCWNG